MGHASALGAGPRVDFRRSILPVFAGEPLKSSMFAEEAAPFGIADPILIGHLLPEVYIIRSEAFYVIAFLGKLVEPVLYGLVSIG